jgi:nucleoside-diphosphate-sugar epimerase
MEALIRDSRASWLILRLSNLVGRNQNPLQLVPALAAQILAGSVSIWRGARRDILDVRHAVELAARVIGSGSRNVLVNIASGVSTDVEQFVDHLCICLNRHPERHYVERPDSRCVSIERLRTIAGDLSEFGFDQNYWRRLLTRYYGDPLL